MADGNNLADIFPGTRKQVWPPVNMQTVYRDYSEHSAWYSGDASQLASIYAGAVAPPNVDNWNTSLPLANAILSLRNRFWSRQRSSPQTRVRQHVPLASDIATASADLLFSEPPEFVVAGLEGAVEGGSEDDSTPDPALQKIQDRLDEIVEEDGIYRTLLEAAEVAAALGGVYLKVAWDVDAADHPMLVVVHPDKAIPEFEWGRLAAVTFWQEVARTDGAVYRQLERHIPGEMQVGLYLGTNDELGKPVPLGDIPATARLAASIVEGNVIPTGIEDMLAVYVPNIKPNRRDRGSDLGRSDYAGIENLLDALDETYTGLMRDVRLSAARIFIPDYLLTSKGKGSGSEFDPDQEAYVKLPGAIPADELKGGGSSGGIEMHQPAIRIGDFQATITQIVETVIASSGYSPATFGMQGLERVQPQTATEIEARERRSFVTRNKKIRYWTPALEDILELLLQVDQLYFPDHAAGVAEISVQFSDSVQDDIARTAATLAVLEQAGIPSTETKLRLAFPDWTEDQITEEIGRIQTERGMMMPAPAGALPAADEQRLATGNSPEKVLNPAPGA